MADTYHIDVPGHSVLVTFPTNSPNRRRCILRTTSRKARLPVIVFAECTVRPGSPPVLEPTSRWIRFGLNEALEALARIRSAAQEPSS